MGIVGHPGAGPFLLLMPTSSEKHLHQGLAHLQRQGAHWHTDSASHSWIFTYSPSLHTTCLCLPPRDPSTSSLGQLSRGRDTTLKSIAADITTTVSQNLVPLRDGETEALGGLSS